MATDGVASQRDSPPTAAPPPSSIPQKRALEDVHSPAVSSPLNPEVKTPARVQVQAPDEASSTAREKRTKKESLKKRESKGGANGNDSTRATPDPNQQDVEIPLSGLCPMRYKLAPPKPTDFDPPRGPVFSSHHVVQDPDGRDIEFFETSDQ